MDNKKTKPIKAIDDSYKALTNKDRAIIFVKGFGSVALTFATLIACAGSLNYGVEYAKALYIIMGALGFAWCVFNIARTFKTFFNR
jgi:hypothetical protein